MAVRRQGRPDQGFTAARRLELADFALNESVSRQQRAIPVHSHNEPHLTIILEGRCREVYRGVTCLNGPLTVSYFHPGESHSLQVFDTPTRTFDIELNPKWLDRILPDSIAPGVLLRGHGEAIPTLMTRLYQEFRERDDLSGLAIEGLTLEILVELARASRGGKAVRTPKWLRRVHDLIQVEYARPLTLSDLAGAAQVHPSHLAEVFRERYHCTVGEYIRRMRVQQAIRQMSRPDLSLAVISGSVGFSDQSHFTRVFKRITGMTPAQYRTLNFDPGFVPNTQGSSKTERES